MKKMTLAFLMILVYGVSKSQNTFPTSGNVGIGTISPTFNLDVIGSSHVSGSFIADATSAGAISGFFRSSSNANLVLQGGSSGYQAWWITGANGVMKIGGNGGTEPTVGAINITDQGRIGIGTTNPGTFLLAVEGGIGARSLKVTLQNPWPDYVFEKKYKLLTLHDLEQYVHLYKHLPGIPSAEEVQKNGGIDIGQMNAKLLEKIEELTTHLIDLNKKVEKLERVAVQKKKITKIKIRGHK